MKQTKSSHPLPGGFVVGERVWVVGPSRTLRPGEVVTVRGRSPDGVAVAVEVDDSAGRVLHECDGQCGQGVGWYAKPSILSRTAPSIQGGA